MSRQPRVKCAGAFYHVTSAGVHESAIFLDDTDRVIFLELLTSCVDKFKWRVHSYCLMTTHYHLLIETPEDTISEGMKYLNGHYSIRFNRRHSRKGHLLKERYWSKLIDSSG
ncbi:MAG: transposase, partial [Actinomycetota bacterium]